MTVERRIKGRIRSLKLFAAFVLQSILLHIRFMKQLQQNSPSPGISDLLSPYFYKTKTKIVESPVVVKAHEKADHILDAKIMVIL